MEANTIQRNANAEMMITRGEQRAESAAVKNVRAARAPEAGCPARSILRSPPETGSVSRYAIIAIPESTQAAAPKLNRHITSASDSDGLRNIVRKPSSVGDQPAITD